MSKREKYTFAEPPAGTRTLWRSLSAKADPDKAREEATAEFDRETVHGLVDASSIVSRRGFLTLTGAIAAVGGSGCVRRPAEKILPFTKAPEYAVPGKPLHYATVVEHRGEAVGLLVTNHDGRPTKVEGNPLTPASLGGTNASLQALTMELYDADRSRKPTEGAGTKATPEDPGDTPLAAFQETFLARLKTHEASRGKGLRILCRSSRSPSVHRARQLFLARFPEAKVHHYDPVSTHRADAGAAVAFGTPARTTVDFARAKVLLSIDSDFLDSEPGAVRAARAFADGRRLRDAKDD
ncbi:MAG: twin-arginine translocation signal domain-containing protein, partial [Myxococcales bacterium]|nr:twin-arginine translocation signal domain-containing protein [Myxococcales bacterium]